MRKIGSDVVIDLWEQNRLTKDIRGREGSIHDMHSQSREGGKDAGYKSSKCAVFWTRGRGGSNRHGKIFTT